eukprot:TRINITY_DN641_c0_g1_i2.p2 TRINITY_DN641_c0_g1~~TRINITY_DN641_c0_g1_i2.p2  ORF type:complete len:167 (-),score=41.16 TRINITY_DN641_c0_g1_i2:1140-1640(-)
MSGLCCACASLSHSLPLRARAPSGIDYLKEVVISDKLGINAELENQMQFIVDTYQDEWASVVKDPEQRKSFRQFVNTDEVERGIGMIPDREQFRPIDWPRDSKPLDFGAGAVPAGTTWVKMGVVDDFPIDGGATVKYGESQLAVYRFESRNVGLVFIVDSPPAVCS